jgi:hypothetical protein
MSKDDAETSIRILCSKWAEAKGISLRPSEPVSFCEFKNWLDQNGWSHCLNFRAAPGPDYVAELWFDQEFGQAGLR